MCVNFTIERWYPVANMSRYLPIRVYDYYAPGMFLIKIKYIFNVQEQKNKINTLNKQIVATFNISL